MSYDRPSDKIVINARIANCTTLINGAWGFIPDDVLNAVVTRTYSIRCVMLWPFAVEMGTRNYRETGDPWLVRDLIDAADAILTLPESSTEKHSEAFDAVFAEPTLWDFVLKSAEYDPSSGNWKLEITTVNALREENTNAD